MKTEPQKVLATVLKNYVFIENNTTLLEFTKLVLSTEDRVYKNSIFFLFFS